MPRNSKHRYTFTILQAGQPRPYADTIHVCQLFFEWQGMEGYKDENAPFVPNEGMSEDYARRYCKFFSGWAEEGEGDWASTRLKYIREVAPGVWEWKTQSAFTD